MARNDQATDYLPQVQNAATWIENLMNSPPTNLRVTSQAQPFVPVDLSQVAREAVFDLAVHIEQTDGRIEVGNLPTVEADPTQMQQLLGILISYALKFHRKQDEPPIVRVGAELINKGRQLPAQDKPTAISHTNGRLCQVTVKNDDSGSDEKYVGHIFQALLRPRRRRKCEGTSVGMATCRQIVERHGGSLTARGAPGQGTTFVITLPLEQIANYPVEERMMQLQG
jgi:light-regulated signal transduction histidine kinase (bacteriophytochrome)